MNNRKKDLALIISFISIIFICLGLTILNYGYYKISGKVLESTDNWKYFEGKKENNILDKIDNLIKSKEVTIENISNNHFPLYYEIMGLYNETNYKLNSLLYKKIIPIKENSEGKKLFYNKENDFYYPLNNFDDEYYETRYNEQVEFFNNINAENLYIYGIPDYEMTPMYENNKVEYIKRFKKDLNDNISFDYLKNNTIKDYLDNMYKTDHHWTANGAIKGYKDIMNLMGKDSLVSLQTYQVSNRKMIGSYGKQAFLENTYDYLYDINVHLNYDVNVKDSKFKPRKIDNTRTYAFYDEYIAFYNGQYDEIIYDYHNSEEENLLIVCDSFAWPIDYLIASSFNKTFVINIRYGDFKNNNFDLTNYVKDNDIDKVLFIYELQEELFDINNFNLKERIK